MSKISQAVRGLPGKGSAAQRSRNYVTGGSPGPDKGFGSPWRGIVGVSETMAKFLRKGTKGGSAFYDPRSMKEQIELFAGLEGELGREAAKLLPGFKKALDKGRESGMIFINKDEFIKKGFRRKRSIIVHERSHELRRLQGTHDFPINLPAKPMEGIDKIYKKAASLYGYAEPERYAGKIHEEVLAYAREAAYLENFGKIFSSLEEHMALTSIHRANPLSTQQLSKMVYKQIKQDITQYTQGGLARHVKNRQGSRTMSRANN